jgi:hypothetical protein
MRLIDSKRELAARVAGQAELRDIQVFKLVAELIEHPAPGVALDYNLDTDPRCVTPDDTNALIVEVSYDLVVRQPLAQDGEVDDESGVEHKDVARIELLLAALFDLPAHPDGRPYSEDEFRAFADTSGQFALYPYARQSITDLTTRLALPPLVLGMLKLDLDPDDE